MLIPKPVASHPNDGRKISVSKLKVILRKLITLYPVREFILRIDALKNWTKLAHFRGFKFR